MNIVIGKTSGFCNGVEFTINKANELVNKNKIYCLGEIVHNEQVIRNLENKGMITVANIEDIPNNSRCIIRAHGELKETYDKAKNKNIELVDLTCGKIRAIKAKILKKVEDHYIIIVGKKNHPETMGVKSFAGENSKIIEDEIDVDENLEVINNKKLDKIYIVSQTTFNSNKFDRLVDYIKEKLSKKIIIDKTICDATRKRQEETKVIASKVDTMIIVGGKKSSNTKELEIISKEVCKNVLLIQDAIDLSGLNVQGKNIGIMAGASTPSIVVEEIVEKLNKIGSGSNENLR